MKGLHRVHQYAVVGGAAFVLAQVFEPGLDDEDLHPALGVRAVARALGDRVEVVKGDVRRPADLDAAVEGQDVIVHLAPPRRVDDPVEATDVYTGHKIECERLVRDSGLVWTILRFADVPPIALRDPHPIMFTIPLGRRLLEYQRHAFDDVVRETAALLGWRAPVVRAMRPLLRWRIGRLARVATAGR